MYKPIKLIFHHINLGKSIEYKFIIILYYFIGMLRKIVYNKKYFQVKLNIIRESIINNIKIQINSLNYILLDFESLTILSPLYEDYISNYLQPEKGDVFIDIGAHLGKYTLPIAKIVGDKGLVISIEAHPINYKYLIKNIKLNSLTNIIPLNIAAWEDNCKIKIFHGDVAGHHSIKINKNLGYIHIQARIMDDMLEEINIKKVNWIKIDVEDAEYECLKGLIKTLKRYKPKIIIEVFPRNYEKISILLKKNGYNMTKISPPRVKYEKYYIAEPLYFNE